MIRTKHSWIIGGGSGIGAALANALAERGEVICLSGRNKKNLQTCLKTLPCRQADETHIILPCDVTEPKSIADSFAALRKQWRKVDRIIFMAGDYTPMRLDKLSMKAVDNMVKVNLTAAFYLLDEILPFMKRQKRGQIIFCASLSGYRGLPFAQPYGATKAGLMNLCESLRAEVGKDLDIKLINPGFVKSRLTDKNNFTMPFLTDTATAARAIVKDIDSRKFEITFPKRFAIFLKFLRLLPDFLYFRLVRKKGRKK